MSDKDGHNPGFLDFPLNENQHLVLCALFGKGDFVQVTGDWGNYKYLAIIPSTVRLTPGDTKEAILEHLDPVAPGICLLFESLEGLERLELSLQSVRKMFDQSVLA